VSRNIYAGSDADPLRECSRSPQARFRNHTLVIPTEGRNLLSFSPDDEIRGRFAL